MAPKKGTKRTQETRDGPVEKKQKSDLKLLMPIIEGIEQANSLSDSCREMLLAAVPGSLGTASDLRHETQDAFVKMIGEALDGVVVRMQLAFDEQKAALEELESSKSMLMSKLAQAKDALAEAESFTQSKESELADKVQAFQDAKAALQEKEDAQRTGDTAAEEASKQKSALDKILEIDLKAIVEGEVEQADANAHYKSLEPFFCDLILDDSLKSALPLTCVKPKSQRGSFDNMVIDELQKCFSKKTAELSQTLAEAVPRKAERDAAVQSAQAHVKYAQDLQCTAAEEFDAAKESVAKASEAVKVVEAEAAAYEPQRVEIERAKDAKAAILDNFKQYNVGCFELLRGLTSKPITTPQGHVETPGEQDKAEVILVSPTKVDVVVDISNSDAPITIGGA